MMTSTLRKRRAARSVAGIAAAGLAISASVAGGPSAGADPKQYSALIGVGSDTTQDILNALSGFQLRGPANTIGGLNYTPVQSNIASSQQQLASWDAIGTSTCITPKAPGATFLRPNGSSNGRRALSRAIDGAAWPTATPDCGGPKVVSGLVDFARSSAGPSSAGTELTYVPFGRDGLGFAYYKSDAATVPPVTTLTSAQLTSLFSTGPQTIGGVEIVPCGIQTGSGTYQSWNTALGINQATETTGTTTCTNASAAGRLQENDGNGLKAKGDLAAFAGRQVIVGFSAANFIAQSNGVVNSQLPAPAGTVDLGSIDSLGKPYTGTAPNLASSGTFYASTVYGRDVYNVVPTAKLGGLASANQNYKSLFVGSASAICSATTTIQAFGFASLGSSCGSTTLTGPLVAN